MNVTNIKHMFEGFSSLRPLIEDSPELLEKVVLNLYQTTVGKNVEKLKAIAFSDGVLTLAARSEAWKKEGISQSDHIRNGVNAAFGKNVVSEIVWGKWTGQPKGKSPGSVRKTSKNISQEMQDAADKIVNPEVREAFLSFVRAFAAKGKAGN